MKITWKEGSETHTAQGTQEALASHIAYLEASGIKWEEVKRQTKKAGDEDVSQEDNSK